MVEIIVDEAVVKYLRKKHTDILTLTLEKGSG